MTSSSEIENYQNMSIFPSKKNDKEFFFLLFVGGFMIQIQFLRCKMIQ